ncbi:eIF5-mimic protein 1-like [Sycon ciliatum]|uniref:eIF5-mimic protein 1-like n=1 Tax=Sycon ciliatum TaxID=27933 RepID=UPI0031F63FEC|eukprot:scpid61700/ scgid24748/ Basic leucine zipper and W2 domain-containing protein 2; Brain development-related molecule 2
MSQKVQKPTLTGQRLRTRKRDEKEKYEPLVFRDAIIAGVNDCTDLDSLTKFLDTSGNSLNYRRYAEVLFDILFAGGMLAPGGSIVQDGADQDKPVKADLCVFQTEADTAKMREFGQVFDLLLRRYKYLQVPFVDDLEKILKFLKGFSEDERSRLAMITGVLIGMGLVQSTSLNNLLGEHLVKEGLSLQFITEVFLAYVTMKDINSLTTNLRKGGFSGKLLEVLPSTRRTQENFEKHFQDAGLGGIVDMYRNHQAAGNKKIVETRLIELVSSEADSSEIKEICADLKKKHDLQDTDILLLIWKVLMSSMEWSKKEDILAEQALKHIKKNASLLASFSSTPRAQLGLMVKIQEYCYEHVSFMKIFHRMVMLLYQSDVIGESAILQWHKSGHSSKGKSVFLDQLKPMIDWLENAEEESSEDEEDED